MKIDWKSILWIIGPSFLGKIHNIAQPQQTPGNPA